MILIVLKSDHFGIEINTGQVVSQDNNSLKSDHFGIEMLYHYPHNYQEQGTKIRPFWD